MQLCEMKTGTVGYTIYIIVISSDEEEGNESDDLPNVKYLSHVSYLITVISACWVGIFTVSVPLRKATKGHSINTLW